MTYYYDANAGYVWYIGQPGLADDAMIATVAGAGGRRPAGQLAAVLRPDLLTYLVGPRSAAGHLQPRLRRVLTQRQSTGALEAVALLTLNTGVPALAGPFEPLPGGSGNRWRCTALQLRLTSGDLAAHRRSRDPR